MARQGKVRYGFLPNSQDQAWRGGARQGMARTGMAWIIYRAVMARIGPAGRGKDGCSLDWHGKARIIYRSTAAWRGPAGRGPARLGWARFGEVFIFN